MKKVIVYLHGFNSASLSLDGNLLIKKDKLRVLQRFCVDKNVLLFSPNIDYRNFQNVIEDMLYQWNHFLDQGNRVVFMGSSMGGFASEYLALKTGEKAIMINPVITPSELLTQFIGVTANYETGEPYEWTMQHCTQYLQFEQEIANHSPKADRTILLDLADELIDSHKTIDKYRTLANIVSFEGGSHGFEHMSESLSTIQQVLFT